MAEETGKGSDQPAWKGRPLVAGKCIRIIMALEVFHDQTQMGHERSSLSALILYVT